LPYKYSLDDVNEKPVGTVFVIKDKVTGETREIEVDEYITLLNKGELEI
jgi:hypothetical protein